MQLWRVGIGQTKPDMPIASHRHKNHSYSSTISDKGQAKHIDKGMPTHKHDCMSREDSYMVCVNKLTTRDDCKSARAVVGGCTFPVFHHAFAVIFPIPATFLSHNQTKLAYTNPQHLST